MYATEAVVMGYYKERRDAIDLVMSAIDRLFFDDGSLEATLCPCCDCHVNSRYGRNRSGTQRFRCGSCGKVFTPVSNDRAMERTKLDRDVWMRFAECFVDGIPFRDVMRVCGVSMNTAWYMRMRLVRMMPKTIGFGMEP